MSFKSLLKHKVTIRRRVVVGTNSYGEQIIRLKTVARNVKCRYDRNDGDTLEEMAIVNEFGESAYTFFLPIGTDIKQGDYLIVESSA